MDLLYIYPNFLQISPFPMFDSFPLEEHLKD